MRLQFYLGRAGSGKTRRCLDDIVERLREDPSPRGHPLILLLPEQATAQAEAALLQYPGVRGVMRARVFSFKRLAREVLAETGGAAAGFLGDLGRQMLLRALAARHRAELKVFGRSVREAGFIARLAATFGEIAHFRHTFEELDALRRKLEEGAPRPSLLARKLSDLVLLGRAFESALRGRAANPDHFLDELARRLPSASLLAGAEVWMDGFASLMPQELRAVEAILRQARVVRAALLLDPAEADALPAGWRDADPTRLFSQTEETYLRLKALALDTGTELLEPLRFPRPAQPTRFSPLPGFAAFANALAGSGMTPVTANFRDRLGADGPPLPAIPHRLPPLLLVEAATRRDEIECVARAIRRLAREDGLRWRDIALVARDLEPYDALIRSTFARHGIPCFFDRRRPLTHHPLVELLRSAVRAAAGDWATEDVVHYLKTDFAPLTRHEADLLENDALRRGVRGRVWWLKESGGRQGKAWSGETGTDGAEDATDKTTREEIRRDDGFSQGEAALNPVRRRALAPLEALGQALANAAASAANALSQADPMNAANTASTANALSPAAFARALKGFLEMLRCDEILRRWTDEAAAAGDLDLAGEHAQVWESIVSLLTEMEESLGQDPMPLAELAEALEGGLAALTLALPPPSLDQVLAGTIERSRQPDLRAVFVIGLNEKVFPAPASEDVIFSDADRAALLSGGDFELAPPSRVQLFRERYLAYVACTRHSRNLWLSWTASGEDGKEMRPSPFVQAALEAATAAAPESGPGFWSFAQPAPERHTAITELELSVEAVEGILRAGAAALTPAERGCWSALENRFAQTPDASERLAAARQALRAESREAALDPAAAVEPLVSTSVSRLETFAQCPFRYFAQYVLGLREREVFEIRPVDIGNFHHNLLREIFHILARERGFGEPFAGFAALDWGKVPEADALDALETALGRRREEFLATGALRDSHARFLLDRSRRQIETCLLHFVRQGVADRFLQVAAELSFGFEKDTLPPLRIDCSGGPVALRGRIDRLDAALAGDGTLLARIYDFKSSERELNLSAVLGGLALQLLVYLETARKNIPDGRPAGAFFFPIRKKTTRVSAPPPGGAESDDDWGDILSVTPRGVVDGGTLDYFGDATPGARHPWTYVRIKADGSPGSLNTSDHTPPGKLEDLCRHAVDKAAGIAGEIRSRRIAVHPCRFVGVLACAHCDFADVCRMNPHATPVRDIPALKREDALSRID